MQLVVMLYDGAIRFIKGAIQGAAENDYSKINVNLGKAQTIISELMSTLDFKYDISQNLYSLYEYTNFLLVEANIQKSSDKMNEALGYLVELRETWIEVNKLAPSLETLYE